VTFEATRGQGTRLLDRRRTVEVAAGPGDVIPWIRGTVRMNERAPSCHLRGAVAGERIGDRLINDVLAEAGVPFSDRWWWPCLFVRNRCVEIVGIETESDTQPIASFLEFSSTRATSLG
jgi:hypothetical protein